jgi:hypothetical protein
MTGTISGVGHIQALQGLDGSVHRVSAISLVGRVWRVRTRQRQGS